jgi:NADPH:quinone reductase-like Zn-dependent oxidoreductase
VVENIQTPLGCVTSLFISSTATKHDTGTLSSAVKVVQFSDSENRDSAVQTIEALSDRGWDFTIQSYESLHVSPPDTTILVIDEMNAAVLSDINEPKWQAIQMLLSSRQKILWVTTGAQFLVSNPHNALFHGLARSARAESAALSLKTLDVQSSTSTEAVSAIHDILTLMQRSDAHLRTEDEYCERGGIIYTSRVLPNSSINNEETYKASGRPLVEKAFHENPLCVRMRCEQSGAIDSLHFSEISDMEIPLENDFVEVELHATGLNYKDVATILGILPADRFLLGLEGAGIIKRIGAQVQDFKIGDRVLVDMPGCMSNRVQVPVQGVHTIPDQLSFEDASTMCIAFLTSIHGLVDLAQLKPKETLLIHSASGGLGIAAIQIGQLIGAEIYATVGNSEKRKFLIDQFGIPDDHIFSSRSLDFAKKIMVATGSRGIDVVLNSLTGDLLDESWRCMADRGRFVEVGKKDILNRNSLSMEPFNRNACFLALDMSHSSISRNIIASLLARMMNMYELGEIQPISPKKVYSFTEIPDAIRYMRGATHIGKVVFSDGNHDPSVPTRETKSGLRFNPALCYAIIGGLKGIGGSLAIYLARSGAKHLVILSRSSYDDEKSRTVLKDLSSLGAQVCLTMGDVAKKEDVQRMFQDAPRPIGGIIQAAMVLRVSAILFTSYPSLTVIG